MNRDQLHLRNCIQKVATGPEYSKDLGFDEARDAMRYILSGDADPVQAAVLLIALRMKRETDDENGGILQAILDTRRSVTTRTDEVLDIADPYNGQLRGLPLAPFLAPLLAACGLPAFSHGVRRVGPKFGITHHLVLEAAGVDVSLSPEALAQQLDDPAIGWGYFDQDEFCPSLGELVGLRERIVKRPVLTTVEVLAHPVSGARRTHFMTGYVHKAYPPVYTRLARQAGFDSAVIIRGVEGGVIPSLQQPAKVFGYRGGADGDGYEMLVEPATVGIAQTHRAVPLPDSLSHTDDAQGTDPGIDVAGAAQLAAQTGIAALHGEPGAARDSLVYGAAIALHMTGRCDQLVEAADLAREALDDGTAKGRFEAGTRAGAPA